MFPIVPLMTLSSSMLLWTFFFIYFSQSILKALYWGQICNNNKGTVTNVCLLVSSFFHHCGTNKKVDKINGMIIMYPRVLSEYILWYNLSLLMYNNCQWYVKGVERAFARARPELAQAIFSSFLECSSSTFWKRA